MRPEDKVKETLHEFNRVTTPVLTDILAIAQKGVAEALAALQRAQKSVPDIANAAVNVGSAQADLIASTGPKSKPPQSQ
jgi:hypothetical protein